MFVAKFMLVMRNMVLDFAWLYSKVCNYVCMCVRICWSTNSGQIKKFYAINYIFINCFIGYTLSKRNRCQMSKYPKVFACMDTSKSHLNFSIRMYNCTKTILDIHY